jgi:hypothetical protein
MWRECSEYTSDICLDRALSRAGWLRVSRRVLPF